MPVYNTSLQAIDGILRRLRSMGIGGKVVLGGPEFTADPDNIFECFPDVQLGFLREADESLLEFVKLYTDNKEFHHIPGLVYRDGSKIIKNPPRLISNLNALPTPDHRLLSKEYMRGIYWRLGYRGSTDIIVSSRGCPFSCHFCFKIEKRARFRSAESVHSEIQQILSMGIKNIHFMDDLLVLSLKRVKSIFDPIDPRWGIKFKVRARASDINDELVEYLAHKGVKEIVCGYESGSERMLKLMNKKVTVEQNYNAVRTIKKYGIKALADMMILYPGENWESARDTIRFINEAKPTYVHWSSFAPFTGIPITRELKEKGLLEGKLSINQYPKVKYDYLTEGEFERLTRYMTKEIDRYNKSLFRVILPNLFDILLNSGLKQYRMLLERYLGLSLTKLS